VGLAFATANDRVPGTVNTGPVTLGFTVATPIPVGGKITLVLPINYFSAVDPSALNHLSSPGATCLCALTKAAGAALTDAVTCTTAGAVVQAGAQTLTLIAGAVTTGAPQAAGALQVSTSTDRELANATTAPDLGGQLTSGVGLAFATANDRVPGTVNTGPVTLGFTVATPIPVGGSIHIRLPRNYLILNVESGHTVQFDSGVLHSCSCHFASAVGSFDQDSIHCSLLFYGCVDCPLTTPVSFETASSGLVFSFIAPKPGKYQLILSSSSCEGLSATFYSSIRSTTAAKHWTISSPVSSVVGLGEVAEWTLSNAAGRVGVNFVGLIKPPATGLYNFFIRSLLGHGRGDMWIGNTRIIFSEGTQEGSFFFASSTHHDFQIAYYKINDGDSKFQIDWESKKLMRQPIQKRFLCTSNWDLNVQSLVHIH
jgi:hypothetical protein